MSKQRIIAIAALVILVIGMVCVLICTFQAEKNPVLLNTGLILNALGIVTFFVLKKGMSHQEQEEEQEDEQKDE